VVALQQSGEISSRLVDTLRRFQNLVGCLLRAVNDGFQFVGNARDAAVIEALILQRDDLFLGLLDRFADNVEFDFQPARLCDGDLHGRLDLLLGFRKPGDIGAQRPQFGQDLGAAREIACLIVGRVIRGCRAQQLFDAEYFALLRHGPPCSGSSNFQLLLMQAA
jgi:hypothetical protein